MRYEEMVRRAPMKSEEVMWQSIGAVDALLERLEKVAPDEARRFMMGEYARMYGGRFCEEMAREEVARMWHYNDKGEKVEGEMVTVDAVDALLGGVGDAGHMRWDLYVGANAMMHDLARTDLTERQIMEVAKVFWLQDDDFAGESKVMWYFKNK